MEEFDPLKSRNAEMEYARSAMPEITDMLGLTLVMHGLVDSDTVKMALKKREVESKSSSSNKRGLAQILVQDYQIDHDLIFSTLAAVYDFRIVNLSLELTTITDEQLEFIKTTMEKIPQETRDYMLKNKIIIYKLDEKVPQKFIFITQDPTDKNITAIVRHLGIKQHEICYAPPEDLQILIDKAFPPEKEFLKDLEEQDYDISVDDFEEDSFDEEQIEAEINKSLLVNLAEGMLREAVKQGASDIHIIPVSSNETEINFRIDGMLRNWHTQKGVRPEALAAVMKDRSKNVDRFEREAAQDGFIQRKIDEHMIRYRVSVIPIVGREYQYKFESIVIRILDDRKVITDLDKLGFHGFARELFLKAIRQPQGMVIVTGPTGSGKSTTLIAALSYIVNPEINVLTVEDPVEYIIPNVRQLKISHKMNFESALRAILRHDPDVVMLGEIRDKETGETAIKLANTGHLTFSTLHTNDAPSAVSRLFKMGIETFLIAYAINIIIAQRLMRKVCQNCKVELQEKEPGMLHALGFTDEEIERITFYQANPDGCEKCHKGYKGRTAIHEALYFTKEIRRLIFEAKGDINEEAIRQQAISDGMLTLQDHARYRVEEGLTTLEEVARVTSDD